jgi:hypothetical protein
MLTYADVCRSESPSRGPPLRGLKDLKGGGSGEPVSLGLKALVALLDDKRWKPKVVMFALQALSNVAGAQFTGFTRTKVQILTQKARCNVAESGGKGAEALVTAPLAAGTHFFFPLPPAEAGGSRDSGAAGGRCSVYLLYW